MVLASWGESLDLGEGSGGGVSTSLPSLGRCLEDLWPRSRFPWAGRARRRDWQVPGRRCVSLMDSDVGFLRGGLHGNDGADECWFGRSNDFGSRFLFRRVPWPLCWSSLL
jgi:hypothetical protein